MKATLNTINTTAGKRFVVVTFSRSKSFKTLKGAEAWMLNNGYTRVNKLDF